MKLEVIQIGNSEGVALPKEVLARLEVVVGDYLYLAETPTGYALSRHDPDFADQMKAAREIMKVRRTVLRDLSK